MLNFILTKLGVKFRGSFDLILDKGLLIEHSSHVLGKQFSLLQGTLNWGVCTHIYEDFPRGKVLQSFKGISYL